jgi:dienelactone hydrolase
MRRAAVVLMIVVGLIGLVPTGAGAAGDHQVRHVTLTLVDHGRPTEDPTGARSADSRTLVTEVYIPRGKGPFPLVVFAHGNAGNPGKLTQMLGAWARAGYVVAAPAFPLTNDLTDAPSIIVDYVNQPADVSFVIDRVLRQARRPRSPLYRRVNAHRIGLAGHSLGGGTAYGVAFNDCCRDRRIDAVITMDAVRLPFGDNKYDFSGKPLLMIHIVGDPVVPFSTSEDIFAIAAPPKYLMALNQGIHFEPFENAPSPHDAAVIAATTAFWDGYLKHRPAARRHIVAAGTEAGLSRVTATLH